jgi:hypothetical protein
MPQAPGSPIPDLFSLANRVGTKAGTEAGGNLHTASCSYHRLRGKAWGARGARGPGVCWRGSGGGRLGRGGGGKPVAALAALGDRDQPRILQEIPRGASATRRRPTSFQLPKQ